MENNNVRFWIQFSNGYTNASFQAMREFLNSLCTGNWDGVMDAAVRTINDLLVDVAIANTEFEANVALGRLVGFTEGLTLAVQPYQPESRIYGYFYDAISIAEIVPYEHRLDN